MSLGPRRLPDAASLQAVAHPTRLAMLDHLVAHGPKTATELAAEVQVSASNASWHLRRLCEAGFVRAARSPDAKQRPWQAVAEAWSWEETGEGDPVGEVETTGRGGLAWEAFVDATVDHEVHRLRRARAARAEDSPGWQAATGASRARMRLSGVEAEALREDLRLLLERYAQQAATRPRQGAHDPAAGDEGAWRDVSVVAWVVPTSAPVQDPAG